VERLVSLNLVERKPAPSDRRSMIVTLTPEGRRSFRSLARTHEDWIAEIFAGLEPGEIDTLMKLLSKTKASTRRAIDAGAAK
jgi:DNA-binding MarR family transcriptional regulator